MHALELDQGTGGGDHFILRGEGADDVIGQIVHTEDLRGGEALLRSAAEIAGLIPKLAFEGGEGSLHQLFTVMLDEPHGIGIKTVGEGDIQNV